MAEILINGMEMPTSCYYCRFASGGWHKDKGAWCDVLGVQMEAGGENPPVCPLIELPPHGRLVDIDKMIAESKETYSPVAITSTEDLADFLEEYADLDKTDHTVIVPASEGE